MTKNVFLSQGELSLDSSVICPAAATFHVGLHWKTLKLSSALQGNFVD